MSKYYYRFDDEGALGREMRKFWHDCRKADDAAELWAKKFGGESAVYYQDPKFFAGSVRYLSFPPEAEVNKDIWRRAGEANGDELYEPNCSQRPGCITVPRIGFKPSDTAHRIYEKRYSHWLEVKQFYTTGEWAEKAGLTLTGKPKEDEAAVDMIMQHQIFVKFVEFHGEESKGYDKAKKSDAKSKKKAVMPWTLRKAIEAERQRMSLPTVSTERLYQMLRAETPVAKEGKPIQMPTETPTFFYYGGRYYVGISLQCHHTALEEISEEIYRMKLNLAEREQQN